MLEFKLIHDSKRGPNGFDPVTQVFFPARFSRTHETDFIVQPNMYLMSEWCQDLRNSPCCVISLRYEWSFDMGSEFWIIHVIRSVYWSKRMWRVLTHWGRVTQICVSNLTTIGSDNGLLPGRRQAVIWTNVGILLIGPLGTNFNEILIVIQTFSFKTIRLNVSSGKWRPFCLCLNVLSHAAKIDILLV